MVEQMRPQIAQICKHMLEYPEQWDLSVYVVGDDRWHCVVNKDVKNLSVRLCRSENEVKFRGTYNGTTKDCKLRSKESHDLVIAVRHVVSYHKKEKETKEHNEQEMFLDEATRSLVWGE